MERNTLWRISSRVLKGGWRGREGGSGGAYFRHKILEAIYSPRKSSKLYSNSAKKTETHLSYSMLRNKNMKYLNWTNKNYPSKEFGQTASYPRFSADSCFRGVKIGGREILTASSSINILRGIQLQDDQLDTKTYRLKDRIIMARGDLFLRLYVFSSHVTASLLSSYRSAEQLCIETQKILMTWPGQSRIHLVRLDSSQLSTHLSIISFNDLIICFST